MTTIYGIILISVITIVIIDEILTRRNKAEINRLRRERDSARKAAIEMMSFVDDFDTAAKLLSWYSWLDPDTEEGKAARAAKWGDDDA